MNTYDLTTDKGKKEAIKFLGSLASVVLNPLLGLSYLLLKKVFSPSDETAKQAELAIKLIKAGKENGVQEMEIKVSHDAGIKIKSELPDMPITLNLGNGGNMELKVKYK
ncbi:hypothetical protein [Leptospira sp. GIMC2001]|uniref:hypothetical protein n=1 Tax=Leptospira sp. GIMC2001 TaxID=1513297 RepID=UPI00234AD43C|nr:hypothetical protein [Leptospira sp. GIMC2001]WCL50794.1 hypothetical protein O4O04_08275 [Leptospira sp. GIMC2001]